jgi:S-formylglutathione hydrolase FrmB
VAVGAHSAALIEKLPNINTHNSRQMSQLRVLGDAFGSPFDPAFWNQNEPITIARAANLAGLKIYFDCGSEDDHGFESGAAALDKLLTSRHVPHEFHLYPGGHDWIYFAEHLPALLEFEFHACESAIARQAPDR